MRRSITKTEFRRFYDRGDLPIQIFHGAVGGKIAWKVGETQREYGEVMEL